MKPVTGMLLSGFILLSIAAFKPSGAEESDVTLTRELAEPGEVDRLQVRIVDPFVELHTGPAAAYPIFHVVDRGESVRILRRKTDWFKIETPAGIVGWVSRAQMQQTLLPDGERFRVAEYTREDFTRREWTLGVTGGEFESAPVFTLFTAFSFTENLALEGHLGQSVGEVSSAKFWKTNLVMQPLPDLKYSPYLTLGLGRINVNPSSTLVVSSPEKNTFAQFGLGVQRYVSRRFLLRFEANEYVIFSTTSTTNDNEEVKEWKFGFAVFF